MGAATRMVRHCKATEASMTSWVHRSATFCAVAGAMMASRGMSKGIVCSDSRVWTRSTAGAGTTGFEAAQGATALEGGTGDDLLQGGRGDDFFIQGFGGRDSIHGGPGSDSRVEGGSGRDLIVDLRGHNQIDCGKGVDKVVTNKRSRVEKCEHVTRR